MDHQLIAQAGTAAVDSVTMIKGRSANRLWYRSSRRVRTWSGNRYRQIRALEGMARQPEMQGKLLGNAIIIAALMEASACSLSLCRSSFISTASLTNRAT